MIKDFRKIKLGRGVVSHIQGGSGHLFIRLLTLILCVVLVCHNLRGYQELEFKLHVGGLAESVLVLLCEHVKAPGRYVRICTRAADSVEKPSWQRYGRHNFVPSLLGGAQPLDYLMPAWSLIRQFSLPLEPGSRLVSYFVAAVQSSEKSIPFSDQGLHQPIVPDRVLAVVSTVHHNSDIRVPNQVVMKESEYVMSAPGTSDYPDHSLSNLMLGALLAILLVMTMALLIMCVIQRGHWRQRRDQLLVTQANVELTRKLSRALEQTDDSVMITDSNGTIEFVNNSFERVSGFTANEVLGKTPSMMKSGVHEPRFYRNMWRIINNGIAFREVMINRRKNGELYYEQKTITPLKDEEGQITHFVSTGKDISEHMEIQQRLNYLANHDVLTGLPNRALFQERLERSLAQARRHRGKLVLMFVELDNFKNINDSLGHAVGDRLLKIVGQRLLLCIRESDTVARLGGDEFAVVLESVEDVNNVARVARTVLDHIAEPLELAEREVVITASIGVTVFPEDAQDSENLCRNADTAVYRAKELGRNGYQFFTADLTISASQRMMLEHGLRHALERNEFELHYQPKVVLADNRVSGVEALLRWNNRELGLVPPDVFVPVLESTGLISEVGDWVLNEACGFVAQMHQRGHELGVAVNVSARQMLEPRLAERIENLLHKHSLGSSALELEITESMLIENIAPSIDELAKLRVLGVKVSVDDFGTGYSSLGYLKRLPIDTLKIDRTFVRDLPDDGEDVAITSAIVALAGSLELHTIAEGVETLEQVEFLRDLGCHQAQGYFFSRPLHGSQLLQWLEQEEMKAPESAQVVRRLDDGDPVIDKKIADE